jgi:nucleotide-binding universal stress UspA family protein
LFEPMKDIVVGVDGSDASWRALAMAIGVARRWEGCTIRICYVSQVPVSAQLGAIALPISPLAGVSEAGELKQAVSEELSRNSVPGEFNERSGDVARELETLAESCHADLIVVGRSRHPALHLGGVPRRVLAMGHRPILVVP